MASVGSIAEDNMLTSRTISSTQGKKDRLRVIIAGGSVAGLSLAHALHYSNIDFVVLEARDEIAPQVGASIAVLPNGARILDQLGIFDDILAMVEPLENGLSWTGDGKLVVDSNSPLLTRVRTGYPVAFLQRRDLLKVLYKHIPDKSKVHTLKRVCKVDHNDSGVVVHCQDGTNYHGDVIVGADGIHSAVRTLMQQHIEITSPGATMNDKNSISAEYNCIFGLGDSVEGVFHPGDSHRSYSKGHSTLSFIGKGGIVYFFLFSKMDKRYHGKDIPRYTKADIEEAVRPFSNIYMTDTITFKMVWEKRTFANMSCVEESTNEHWTSDRFMTPNLGAGGNAAVESAAALANSMSRLGPNPSLDEVRKVLKEFYQKRHERANAICKSANDLTRIEALATLPHKIFALHLIPALGDFLADITCDSMVGAEILESLPPPPKSLTATMPWNPEMGVGKHESKLIRALYALPLLAIFYGCGKTMGPALENALPILESALTTGEIALGGGKVASLVTSYFRIKSIDDLIGIYVAAFTPSIGGQDPASRMQMISLLGDLIPIQSIFMIESIRRGNFLTASNLLPTIFGILYQLKGIGYVAPIYFFLHYVQSPLENYHAADNRLTQMGPVKTIIPTILLSYVLPTIGMFAATTLFTRQWINGIFWQPFPIYASILQRVLSRFVKDTTDEDRIKNPEADMPHLRRIYRFAGIAAACAFLYVRLRSPVPATEVFFSGIRNPSAAVSVMQSLAKTFRYDQICASSAGAIWTMLSFRDLKRAEKLSAGWGRIVGTFAGLTAVVGPGAAMTAMWAWREETLANRKVPAVKED
ncbi:hypothetical protein V501_05682 [Pseudogymnoascus sp. VKM F-4519 (FW-2642)]|nr:hypothetical protein V501_05682 [Pseudogymnoascus sp. VKM F-4519 (FW-2642)]